MLIEIKDALSIIISTSSALLGVVMALLAILPIAWQLIGERISGFFSAAAERSRLLAVFYILVSVASFLILSMGSVIISLLFPCDQIYFAIFSGILLLISLFSFGMIVVLVALVLGSVWRRV